MASSKPNANGGAAGTGRASAAASSTAPGGGEHDAFISRLTSGMSFDFRWAGGVRKVEVYVGGRGGGGGGAGLQWLLLTKIT
jgi:hypothetical protein